MTNHKFMPHCISGYLNRTKQSTRAHISVINVAGRCRRRVGVTSLFLFSSCRKLAFPPCTHRHIAHSAAHNHNTEMHFHRAPCVYGDVRSPCEFDHSEGGKQKCVSAIALLNTCRGWSSRVAVIKGTSTSLNID